MSRYFVVFVAGTLIRCIASNDRLTLEEAEAKRDRLNADLAHQGVKYSECRYALRTFQAQRLAVAA